MLVLFARYAVVGSSPLARGLRHHGLPGEEGEGIIPARAGFTGETDVAEHGRGDHPRSRGVYASSVSTWTRRTGSSPLARGLPEFQVEGVHAVGIIPARAGFTWFVTAKSLRALDHPRSRGVYGVETTDQFIFQGSSPLARGLLTARHPFFLTRRIIPARAGFTLADPWNPNEPVLYQTPAAFTADLGPAPPSCGSAVVVPRWTTTPSGA